MRTTTTVAAAAVVGGVALGASRRNRPPSIALAAVAPELRGPMLSTRFQITNLRALRLLRRLSRAARPPVKGVDITDHVVGARGARVRVIEPHGRARPAGALLWIHGGGMILGRPEQDDQWASTIAKELGIVIVSVGYRLAPEHPYPAAVDDCTAALAWLHDHAAELGIDTERIAVGGASAGGGLAAAVALRARDEDGPPIRFQLLNYPMIDDRTTERPDHETVGRFVWTAASNRFAWSCYAGEPPRTDVDIYAAPARATDLTGLPPAWIGVGSVDLFHDEDVDYAERLDAAGVPCQLRVQPGMYHAAEQFAPKASSMIAYRQSMVDALRDALAEG